MLGLNVLLASIFSIISILSKPGFAVGVIVFSALIWPEYLRIPLGLSKMSIPRIVTIALLIFFLFSGRHKKVKLNKIDLFVFLFWLWTIVSSSIAGASSPVIIQNIGSGFDTFFIYFTVRIAIQSTKDLKHMIPPLAMIAVVMGGAGILESSTGIAPYDNLSVYRTWGVFDKVYDYRLGFLRAKVSSATHIYFGVAMSLVFFILFSLRSVVKNKLVVNVGTFCALLAVLSTLSSGPWIGLICFGILYSFVLNPNMIKWVAWGAVALAVFIEIASNRHFYNLVDYIALNSNTALYRTKLLEVAFDKLDEYWIFGVGGVWPNHWGWLIDGRGHVDLVNHFIWIAVSGGLLAFFLFIIPHVLVVRRLIRAWKLNAHDVQYRKMIFGFACAIIAFDLSLMSVSIFGQPVIISNVLLGIIVSVSDRRFMHQLVLQKSKNRMQKHD